MRAKTCFLIWLCFFLVSGAATADDASDYQRAIDQAKAHAAGPDGWTVNDLRVITGPNSGDGNTYVGSKVIVRTFTKESFYTSDYFGKEKTTYGDPTTDAMWVTTGDGLKRFYEVNNATAENVHRLTSISTGMNSTNSNNIIVEFLVDANNNHIIRPVKDPDIAAKPTAFGSSTRVDFVKPDDMDDDKYNNFKAYYNNWMEGSSDTFPWTQLGYTYLWGRGDSLSDIRGLSEYIVPGGTSHMVYGLYSLQSYLYTDGNGSGDFTVTGDCDTLWAGTKFQPYGSRISISQNAKISGGQGILVFSPGYTIDNRGRITGATSTKFGMDNTENIAILFKGGTSVKNGDGHTPSGENILINSGTITSPGTAVKAEAGDTRIESSGAISGEDYAVLTSSGNDSLTIIGGEVTGKIDLGDGEDSLDASGGAFNFFLNPDQPIAPIRNVETATIADTSSFKIQIPNGSPSVRDGQTFDILTADTLTVNADRLAVSSDLAMLTFSAKKDGGTLQAQASRVSNYYGSRITNRSLGQAIDNVAATAGGDMGTVIGALDTSGNPDNADNLEQTTSKAIFGATFNINTAFSATFADQMRNIRSVSGGSTYSSLVASGFSASSTLNATDSAALHKRFQGDKKDWESFGAVFGGTGNQSPGGGRSGYDYSGGGALLGAGYRFRDRFSLGLMGGYMNSDIDYTDNLGKNEIKTLRVGPYAKCNIDDLLLYAAFTFGYHGVDNTRNIAFNTISRTALSDYNMYDLTPYAGVEYNWHLKDRLTLTPMASIQYAFLHQESHSESDADAAGLDVESVDGHSLITSLGAILGYRIDHREMAFLPEIWANWRHEFLDQGDHIDASFLGTPGFSFTTAIDEPYRDRANLGAGITMLISERASTFLKYNGMFQTRGDYHNFSLGVMIQF